jgi:purine-binding chemotaxis protein CheW
MSELVREAKKDDSSEQEISQARKHLLFNISSEVYGIDIAHVIEIIEVQKITEVPDMPPYIKGVINLRGRVIAVMDLRLRFGMEERIHDDRTCIIVLDIEGTSIGFVVDTVAEVRDIMEKDIEPPPRFKTESEKNRYISGLAKIGDEVKILIDVNKVVHERDLDTINKKVDT